MEKPSPRLRDLLDDASTCAARVMARPAKASFSHENHIMTAIASAASTCTRQDLRAKSVEKPSPRLRDLLDDASTCAARVMARPAKASFSHETT